MSELWLPASVAAAALVFTYVFCVRPMRRGHCGIGSSVPQRRDVDWELAQVRAELDRALAEQQVGDRRADETAAPEPSQPAPPAER
jgi:hypothetical protein